MAGFFSSRGVDAQSRPVVRVPKFRFGVRLLTVLVALSAIVVGGWVLRQRANEYRETAIMYAQLEKRELSLKSLWLNSLRQREELVRQREEILKAPRKQARRKSRISNINPVFSKDVEEKMLKQLGFHETNSSSENASIDSDSEVESIAFEKEIAESIIRNVAHYGQERRKYERAARFPWLSVALPSDPRFRAAYWLGRQEYGHAIADYSESVRLSPASSEPYNSLARIWATCPDPKFRNGSRAIESATRACELDRWRNPRYLDTLAAANAEAGDFEAALRWQQKALDRTRSDSPERPGLKDRMALYKQGKPYREDSGR